MQQPQKTIIVELTEQEVQLLAQLFDSALRYSGMNAVNEVKYFQDKFQKAPLKEVKPQGAEEKKQ